MTRINTISSSSPYTLGKSIISQTMQGSLNSIESSITLKRKRPTMSDELPEITNSSTDKNELSKRPTKTIRPNTLPEKTQDDENMILPPEKCALNTNPDAYIRHIVEKKSGCTPTLVSFASHPKDFFLTPTEEDLASYTREVIDAVQQQDLDSLRALKSEGISFQCCNRFGESVIHMACRRGLTKVVDFLLNEVEVSICVKDDYGRTPLHDACWSREPQFEIVEMILQREPSLLFLKDKRGFTPFSYARMEDWNLWLHYLYEKKDLISVSHRLKDILVEVD